MNLKKLSSILGLAAATLFAPTTRVTARGLKGRDVSYLYRMGAGSPGDVNRLMNASIEPGLIDLTNPPTAYGQAVVVNPATQGFRPFAAGDAALTDAYGITVRPFPTQNRNGGDSASFGTATPPTSGVMDVLRAGYIIVQLRGATPVVKGSPVYIWIAPTQGNNIQGSFVGAATAGSTIQLGPKTTFNGPADPNGITEISFNR